MLLDEPVPPMPPFNRLLGIVTSRFGTGGVGGAVTLPIRNGNKALEPTYQTAKKEQIKHRYVRMALYIGPTAGISQEKNTRRHI